MKKTLTIVANYVNPPIPYDGVDWEARVDGDEGEGPVGRGRTAIDAIRDLLNEMES